MLARLDDRLIRAPFPGRLGFRQVSPGELVTPGSVITTLDDISVIKQDFSIPEVHLNLVREGMHLVAASSAFPGTTFDAEVRTVGSRIDAITRAATVRAYIDNRELILRPGMLLTVHLTTAEREALMVPEMALVQRASQAYVYRIEEGTARLVPVQHGLRRSGWVEIINGLSEGEPVVAEGVIKVRDGAAVTTAAESLSTRGDAAPRAPGR